MSRLACEIQKGYYPTNTETVKKIVNKTIKLNPDRQTTVVDCCAGEGEVIDFFATHYGCKAYACEIDKNRAIKTASKNVLKLLNTDAIHGVSKNTWWAGINFLNPPYGKSEFNGRLENQFVNAWGGVTSKNGVLILVISESSMNDDMAYTLTRQGYKLICSVYDKNNKDYKDYKQFFLILQRLKHSYRENEEAILNAWETKVELNDLDIEPIEIATGGSPEYFREYVIPKWKIDEAKKNSNVQRMFENEIRGIDYSTSSIESPNDGQAALLIASGALSNQILEVNIDGEKELIIPKGTVYKYQKTSFNYDGEKIKEVVEVDAYKTEIYALSLTKGEYIKCT